MAKSSKGNPRPPGGKKGGAKKGGGKKKGGNKRGLPRPTADGLAGDPTTDP